VEDDLRQKEFAGPDNEVSEENMTLCIAGECRHNGDPALVLVADTRVERGLASPIFSELRIGSEDAQKVRDVGINFRALLSGPPTLGDELLAKCDAAIVELEKATPNQDSDLIITAFFEKLRQASRERKKELVEHYIGMNTVLSSREEFLTKSKDVFSESYYNKIQDELRSIGLGGDIILAGFHGDQPLIVRIDSGGGVHWEDHYSVIGAGADIAFALLALNPYDEDVIEVPECVFRLYEAKVAAHANKTVGDTTVFEVLVRGKGSFDISDEFFDLLKSKLRFQSVPEIVPTVNFLIPDGEEKLDINIKTESTDPQSTKDSTLIPTDASKPRRFLGRYMAHDSMPPELQAKIDELEAKTEKKE
jgi:hypothetical protein